MADKTTLGTTANAPQLIAATGAPSSNIMSELHGTIQIVQPDSSFIPEQLFPFLSTLLWVGLIAGLIYIYRSHIEAFLETVNGRLKDGAPFEIGNIKLGIRPQTPEQQRQKLENEITQAVQEEGPIPVHQDLADRNILKATYFTAEDLALREIQAEFGVPVNRQIQTAGVTFDGIFAIDATAYLVEVKLVRSEKTDLIARRSINQFAESIASLKWKNARGLLVVVYDNDAINLTEQRWKLLAAAENLPVSINVRCYHLSQLANKYSAAIH
jgi:hypothetical protein